MKYTFIGSDNEGNLVAFHRWQVGLYLGEMQYDVHSLNYYEEPLTVETEQEAYAALVEARTEFPDLDWRVVDPERFYRVTCRGCERVDYPSPGRADMDCCRGCGSNNVDKVEDIPVIMSFTSLLTKIDLDVAAQDNALFVLGCAERNAFEGEPLEIDWGEGVEVNRKRLVRIREILTKAKEKGRVLFAKQPREDNPEMFYVDEERMRDFLRAWVGKELELHYLNRPNVRDELKPHGFKVLF